MAKKTSFFTKICGYSSVMIFRLFHPIIYAKARKSTKKDELNNLLLNAAIDKDDINQVEHPQKKVNPYDRIAEEIETTGEPLDSSKETTYRVFENPDTESGYVVEIYYPNPNISYFSPDEIIDLSMLPTIADINNGLVNDIVLAWDDLLNYDD